MTVQYKKLGSRAFTLVELLIVIAIISLLSSVVLSNLNTARTKARDAARIQNAQALLTAMELYHLSNGYYPRTFEPGDVLVKLTECQNGTYIPDLVPNYISKLPVDPALNCAGITHSWSYASDGIDYKLITHNETLLSPPSLRDPAWDGGSNPCVLDGPTFYHVGMWTEGAACWSI
ncbi:MAG: type II secretion system protein [bacterium]|nr:type II secretion system protein [bacterium]MDO8741935.1 type II secretion system protein [bacterium]